MRAEHGSAGVGDAMNLPTAQGPALFWIEYRFADGHLAPFHGGFEEFYRAVPFEERAGAGRKKLGHGLHEHVVSFRGGEARLQQRTELLDDGHFAIALLEVADGFREFFVGVAEFMVRLMEGAGYARDERC